MVSLNLFSFLIPSHLSLPEFICALILADAHILLTSYFYTKHSMPVRKELSLFCSFNSFLNTWRSFHIRCNTWLSYCCIQKTSHCLLLSPCFHQNIHICPKCWSVCCWLCPDIFSCLSNLIRCGSQSGYELIIGNTIDHGWARCWLDCQAIWRGEIAWIIK